MARGRTCAFSAEEVVTVLVSTRATDNAVVAHTILITRRGSKVPARVAAWRRPGRRGCRGWRRWGRDDGGRFRFR